MTRTESENALPMEDEPRRLRADAQRNRERLIEAATELFSERGLEVGVGDIAERAGVGRGTLFRNFPSKDDLIAAVIVACIHEKLAYARSMLEAPDPGEALFELIEGLLDQQQTDRALFDALDDTWMLNPDIHAGHIEMLGVMDRLLGRAQEAGAVREDVSAVDLVMMVKGMFEAARSFQHLDPDVGRRQLDLLRAAISTSGERRPLRGRRPTIEDLEPDAAQPTGSP